jgi:hypothetical protein
MTKVAIKPNTPSEEIMKRAALPDVVHAGGKSINIQKPGVLAQFRIVEIVGAKTAMNAVYMDMLMPVQWVTHIDGVEIPQPQTRLELDALIQRLGEEAIVAIGRKLNEVSAVSESDETVKK